MKKKKLLLLSIVLIIVFVIAGCSDDKARTREKGEQQTVQNTTDENVDSSEALNVENDTFTMDDMLNGIGKEEKEKPEKKESERGSAGRGRGRMAGARFRAAGGTGKRAGTGKRRSKYRSKAFQSKKKGETDA